mmetsp:Transcript_3232/g.7978  ORF Transcript_3232/g.7978 Transcript_3232/m.7978 type:complete len:261 (-) Transcript_3232:135-917(-)
MSRLVHTKRGHGSTEGCDVVGLIAKHVQLQAWREVRKEFTSCAHQIRGRPVRERLGEFAPGENLVRGHLLFEPTLYQHLERAPLPPEIFLLGLHCGGVGGAGHSLESTHDLSHEELRLKFHERLGIDRKVQIHRGGLYVASHIRTPASGPASQGAHLVRARVEANEHGAVRPRRRVRHHALPPLLNEGVGQGHSSILGQLRASPQPLQLCALFVLLFNQPLPLENRACGAEKRSGERPPSPALPRPKGLLPRRRVTNTCC